MADIDMSTWTEEQIAEYAALDAELAEQASRLASATAAREAALCSPAAMIAARKAALADEKRAADLEVAEREADAVEAKALVTYGGVRRVARVRTEEGSIILRPATRKECDELAFRATDMSAEDKTAHARDLIRETVLYPSLDAFNATAEKWPGLWATCNAVFGSLIDCARSDIEKKG